MGRDLAVGRLFLVNSSSLWGKCVRLQTRGTAGKRTRSDNQIEEEELEKNSTTMRNDDTYKARRLLYG